MLYTHTGWRRPIGCFKLQAFLAKEPLIIGLFCRKWPMKIRRPVTLRHPVHTHEYVDETYIHVNMLYNTCIQIYMRMRHVTHRMFMLYDIFTFLCVSSTYSVIQHILYDRYTWECVMSHIKSASPLTWRHESNIRTCNITHMNASRLTLTWYITGHEYTYVHTCTCM